MKMNVRRRRALILSEMLVLCALVFVGVKFAPVGLFLATPVLIWQAVEMVAKYRKVGEDRPQP